LLFLASPCILRSRIKKFNMKYNVLVLASIFLLLVSCGETTDATNEEAKAETPNIVFIISDDQAWTD